MNRRLARALAILLVCFFTIGWIWNSVATKDKEARKLYEEGNLDDALAKWRDAQIDEPDKKELHYNIGNALYEKSEYEDAFSEYQKLIDSKDDELRAKTYYNIGNTHYRMGKLPEAIEDYEKGLEITPDDEDAKYNIEFIKKLLEEQEKQQSTSKEEQEEKKEEEEQEQQAQQEQQDKSSGEQRQEEKQEESGKEEREERQEAKKDKTSDEKEMSEEDAVRLLDALKDDEKELQKELRMQPIEGRYRVEKDW
ncbi:MAG: tetratricopeptide repeat protein [Candidatus Omnitrophica bacterium]|nr:tetratricopeptide repeat protein [Candidatus Omnitrophota bacterium]